MNVLNVCKDDWANFAYDNARALEAAGVKCKAVKLNSHLFKYKFTAEILTEKQIEAEIEKADVVQIFHSDVTFIAACKRMRKRVISYPAGSNYRDNFKRLNDVFNPVVEKTAMALPELFGLGAKNEVYIVGAVDTSVEPSITQSRPYIFGHFPSNSKVKGTEKIAKMMTSIQGAPNISQFRYSTRLIDYDQQRRRMMGCDVYIELFNPTLNGNKYGSFGITALEAAAMGKVVVTMNLSADVYKKFYGDCPLVLVTNEKDFLEAIVNLQFLGSDSMRVLRNETRKWVVEKHGYKATGDYIIKNILS